MLDDFESYKRDVEELKRLRDRARGAYSELMKSIRRGFRCKTLKEAKKLSEKLRTDALSTAEEYTTAFRKSKKRWAHKLKKLKERS